MNKQNLTKYFKSYLEPYLKKKDAKFLGFKGTSYEMVISNIEFIASGSGRYLTRSEGVEIELPLNYLFIPKINFLINTILKRHSLKETDITLVNSNNEFAINKVREACEIIVNSEATFINWAEKFEEYWELVIEPFNEKYQKLESLNEKINELDMPGVQQYFGGFPWAFFLAMDITKKCNNEVKYLELKNEISPRLEGLKDNPRYVEKLPQINAVFKDLLIELEG